MKNITIFLFTFLLVLSSCSKESSHVSFSTREISVGSEASSFSVNVEADCQWSIRCIEGNVQIQALISSGSGTINVLVPKNGSYEDVQHAVVIESSDGEASDKLLIKQGKAYGYETKPTSMLSCEGQEFDISLSTNDQIESVDAPEWITFLSSRALTPYTYSFKAEPNKSGAQRKGTITFRGKHKNKAVTIEQDSYEPTGVDVSLVPDVAPIFYIDNTVKCELLRFPVSAIPEYADLSKISVSHSHTMVCKAYMDGNDLCIQYDDGYGGSGYPIEIYFNNKEGKTLKKISVKPLFTNLPGKMKYRTYTGRIFNPGVAKSIQNYFDFELPEDGSIIHLGDFEFQVLAEGTHTFYLYNRMINKKMEVTVEAQKVLMDAYLDYYFDWGFMWSVTIVGTVKAHNMTDYACAFIDGNRALQMPLNKIEAFAGETTEYVENRYSFEIIADGKKDLENKISNFKFTFGGKIDGETFSKSIQVSPKKP